MQQFIRIHKGSLDELIDYKTPSGHDTQVKPSLSVGGCYHLYPTSPFMITTNSSLGDVAPRLLLQPVFIDLFSMITFGWAMLPNYKGIHRKPFWTAEDRF